MRLHGAKIRKRVERFGVSPDGLRDMPKRDAPRGRGVVDMIDESWNALDAYARSTARLESIGVVVCGEPWRELFRFDRDCAIRAMIVHLEAERRMCAAFEAMTLERAPS
jgi:hypothetical protein